MGSNISLMWNFMTTVSGNYASDCLSYNKKQFNILSNGLYRINYFFRPPTLYDAISVIPNLAVLCDVKCGIYFQFYFL